MVVPGNTSAFFFVRPENWSHSHFPRAITCGIMARHVAMRMDMSRYVYRTGFDEVKIGAFIDATGRKTIQTR